MPVEAQSARDRESGARDDQHSLGLTRALRPVQSGQENVRRRANDAPALRQAQMGIAVSTATDIAKSAAGIVLTEAGLAGS